MNPNNGQKKIKQILISEPYVADSPLPVLPYLWGLLKTHWEHYSTDPSSVHWFTPIFHPQRELYITLESPYVDVLGLSCFTWNWRFQCFLAKQIKAINPHCVVIAGGPEPDYKDPDFFKKHPYIDMVVLRDGEITFTSILQKITETPAKEKPAQEVFYEIPGLYLPNPSGGKHIYTGKPTVPQNFPHSPYIEQQAYYEKMLARMPNGAVAIMETTRGCPYRCDFCDWGSATRTKIRKLSLARIKAEIAWFASMKIVYISATDANFGILPQDLETAQLLADAKQKTGYPKHFSYSSAKNNPLNTYEVVKCLYKAGLVENYKFSIQHTQPQVLKATSRHNISTNKLLEVVHKLQTDHIPIAVELILGLPEDTPQLWHICLADLMEWNIHTSYVVYPYLLLPNAPAAKKAFLKKWEIETIDRFLEQSSFWTNKLNPIPKNPSRIIVKTSSFSREDWIKMNMYSAMINAFHCHKVTRLIATYLRFSHSISYLQFYEDLYNNFFLKTPLTNQWLQCIKECYEDFLNNEDADWFMEISQLPNFSYKVIPAYWLFIQACFNLDAFFTALQAYLAQRYTEISNLESLIKYQQNLVILPDYDRKKGKFFDTDKDWIVYFKQLPNAPPSTPLPEPLAVSGLTIKALDQAQTGIGDKEHLLEWGNGSTEERWAQWIEKMVFVFHTNEINTFQQLEKVEKQETTVSKQTSKKQVHAKVSD